MLILVVEPGKAPRTEEISGTLEEMQALVGGTIQAIYPFEEVALVCNDEGKLLGLPFNRGLRDEDGKLYDIICGTFFLCGAPADSDCFTGLTPEQAERFQAHFRVPELFLKLNGRLVCLPMEE